MDQVNEHKRKLARLPALQEEAETDPFGIGDDVHAAYVSAEKKPTTVGDVEQIERFEKEAADLNKTGLAVASIPLLLGGFTTYGALGGLTRIGAGALGSATGSYMLGKAGD